MLHATLVTIYELSTKVAIYLVQVQAVVTSQQGLYKFDILAHLVDITGTSGVVTSGLDTTTQGLVTLKAHYIISLPAVQRNLLCLQLVQHGVGINAYGSVALFGYGIRFFN